MTKLIRYLRHDEGSSVAAVTMVTMVVMALSAGVVHQAQHTTNVSSFDRERLQSESVAEAGVSDAIRRIQAGAGCDISADPAVTLSDSTSSIGSFRTQIEPEAGTVCGQTLKRVVHSWGYAPTGGDRALRHLEVTVDLVPQAGFPYTLFADGSAGTIYVKNNGIVSGDIYAKDLDQTKNNVSAQNILSPGSIETMNNASYSGTLWAGGDINLGQGTNIAKSVIAAGSAAGSDGEITLGNNSTVAQDAIAKGDINLGSGAVVQGTTSGNNPNAPPPPILQKPTFTWDPAKYAPVTPTAGTADQITTALDTNRNNLSGVYHATNTSGTVTLPSNATVTGPLTIVSEGKVSISGTFNASGGPWQVIVVAMSTASDAISSTGSFNGSSGLDILFFTLGGFDMKNGVTFKGAIYANTIDAKNTFTITKSTSLATTPPVGFAFDASSSAIYVAVPSLWREVVPGAPPD